MFHTIWRFLKGYSFCIAHDQFQGWRGRRGNGWRPCTWLLHLWPITYLEMYKAGRKPSSFTSSAFCPKSQKLDSFVIYSSLKVAQSCPTLCNPVDCSPPGSSVHGVLQARILEWVAISFSRGSSRPRDRTQVSHIAGRRFNLWASREITFNSPLG